MKLYSGDLSPYSSKVRMQIYAKGLDHIAVESPTGFMTSAWRESSPSRIGRLPILELDDGQVVVESAVIAEYLEATYPEPSLLGATPLESATVRTLANIADLYLTTNLFNMTGGKGRPLTEGPVRDRATAGLLRGFSSLAEMIGDRGYACLGRLTLADCALVPALFQLENILQATGTPNPIPSQPRIAAYWSAIQHHPAAARVLGEMRRGLDARIEAVRRAEATA
jgi:glutathione S-transferase